MLAINGKLVFGVAVLGLAPSLIVASLLLLHPPRGADDQVAREESHGVLKVLSRSGPYLIILGVAICTVGLTASLRSIPSLDSVKCKLKDLSSVVNELRQKGMNQFTVWADADFTVACTYWSSTRTEIFVGFAQKRQSEPVVREHMLSLPGVKSVSRDEHKETLVLEADADLEVNFERLIPLFVTVRGLAYSDRVYVMYDRIEAPPFLSSKGDSV